ncbi:MAG: hypothetical protein GWN00_11320, partial [Aliifodinibius sp.]|nr:hypothetical protein [candidate division Zixibacteria bacterium]NIT56790.1 hypothetical protein [Fodinibius sp.]NIW47491.1 hypothetical protein [Gammaproteobacteria bacterium]NIS46065.1 hypothetical protein [candidate division Zixibacteria bacterium]NIU14181.1 hypothetical protein [candidate division Zixibacteria bacterium]
VGLLDYFEYFYTVTAFSKPDTVFPVAGGWPSQESALTSNAIQVVPGPDPQPEVGEVAAVPNPYRGDVSYNTFTPKWEKNPPGRPWVEQDRRILFIN